MANDLSRAPDSWAFLRSMTPARIGLPRTGSAVETRANLEFQLAHAEARDAVNESLDASPIV